MLHRTGKGNSLFAILSKLCSLAATEAASDHNKPKNYGGEKHSIMHLSYTLRLDRMADSKLKRHTLVIQTMD